MEEQEAGYFPHCGCDDHVGYGKKEGENGEGERGRERRQQGAT